MATANKTRAPIKAYQPTPDAIRKAAIAEKARKNASKATLKGSNVSKATPKAAEPADAHVAAMRQAANHANALVTAMADAKATGVTFEQMCAEMGIDSKTGAPSTGRSGVEQPAYQGPMLALRRQQKAGVYIKGTNGNPHCADWLATALQALTSEQVVAVLIRAMELDGNPYLHLNPGQQSMNLRNKARGMVKHGMLKPSDVIAAVQGGKA